jgi:branched-chain amino acid transport system permease protein
MELIHVIIQGVLLGGLYALFAAGLSLIFGVMRLVNIAHGDLIVVAAYMAYFTMQAIGVGPFTSQNVLLILFTHDSRRLYAGPIEMASWKFTPDLAVGVLPVIQFIVAVAVIGGLQLLFYRTTLGRSFRATSDDPEIAQLMGIENRHIFALAMALSLAVVAVAGVFIAIRTTFNPFYGPQLLIFGFEAVIMGGLGSLWGTLAGGVLLGLAQAIGGQINVGLPFTAGHVAFLLVLIVRPQGLFPKVSV